LKQKQTAAADRQKNSRKFKASPRRASAHPAELSGQRTLKYDDY